MFFLSFCQVSGHPNRSWLPSTCIESFLLGCFYRLVLVYYVFRCDRILSYGRGIRLLRYKRVDQKLSDHKPVTATLTAEVEVLCHRKLQRALTFTDAEIENGDVISEFIGVDNVLDQPKVGKG